MSQLFRTSRISSQALEFYSNLNQHFKYLSSIDQCLTIGAHLYELVGKGDLDLLVKHFEIVGEIPLIEPDALCDKAARCGYLEIIQWLHKIKGFPITYYTYLAALDGNNSHIVEWLQKKGIGN